MDQNTAPPQPPPQAFQTPEWETPTNPPRRKAFTGRAAPSFKLPAFASRASPSDDVAFAKEIEDGGGSSALRHRTSSLHNGSLRPARGPGPGLRARFDALLPPHRTYPFGLNRRRFLLFVVLPLLVLFLFVLPLALGLGLRHKASQDLPLPTDTGGIFTGDLTYYSPGLGACGSTHSDGDAVGAVSHLVWDQLQQGSNPNTNPLCGRRIRVKRDGRSVDFEVVDRCVGCAATDLDLSPSVFEQVADMAQGRVTGQWAWL